MSINSNYYFIKSAIDKKVAEVIIDQLQFIDTEPALVFDKTKADEELLNKVRKSKVAWISPESWISGMMSHFIHVANRKLFKYDLVDWANPIQYTIYDEYKSHYKWHTDLANGLEEGLIRKLSISLCLSSNLDYEGGEFEILPNVSEKPHKHKMDVGDAIIFSSDMLHRVKPLTSGVRISLVGWYGGPEFK